MRTLCFNNDICTDECACQTPVSWEFNHLDLDTNGVLAGDELRDLDSNGYEHCVMPFIESCDHDKDKQLSEREWCCCFVNYCEWESYVSLCSEQSY